MKDGSGPVYEVTLSVDREIAADFDAWLEGHIRETLELPGFVRASTFVVEADTPERTARVTQYFLEDDEALERYLEGPAKMMRAAAGERFEGRYAASRRVLRHADSAVTAPAGPETCLNCGAPLRGQYCSICGQRARARLISVWELVRDAIGDLFELDSRLWRTIIPLLARPGQLTREYLMGRRVRFMPPFRTYLVLSLVFFLVAFFDPQQKLAILYEPSPETAEGSEGQPQTPEEMRREIYEDLEAEGIIVPRPEANGADAERGVNVRISPNGSGISCDFSDYSTEGMPQWLARRLTKERLEEVCERIAAGGVEAFFNQLLDNVPASLFLLLPLMALILKMLYPLSKRYYVEHLLFVIHFHAFFFLILTLGIVFSRVVVLARLPDMITNLAAFAVALYIPLYLYKSMRRVYEQGRLLSVLKFLVLVFSYLLGFSIILAFTAFYTAFSI
jgi:hypothetical protein